VTKRPLTTGLLIATIVCVLDQASKWWVLLDIMSPPDPIEVLPVFNLVLVWNRGVSFGLFAAGDPMAKWFLIAVAVVIVVALSVWLRRAQSRLVVSAIGLIVGGAAGNVIDRLVHGAVVDFLDFHVAAYHWPAFNIADSAITVGAALLILDSLRPSPQNSASDSAEDSQ